jgi:dipeptidyl aminopeptidase/acylaminoacyl peptidase
MPGNPGIAFSSPTKQMAEPDPSQAGRLICLLVTLGLWCVSGVCGGTQRRFTVADDIELSHFGDPYTAQAEPITYSPDGRYFVVTTQRGRRDLNRPESTLRLYRTKDVRRFLGDTENTSEPLPLWIVSKSSYRDGPIITHIRWLADASGIAFLVKNSLGNDQLFLLDLKARRDFALTRTDQQVTSFDVRDRNHYVYCIQSPAVRENSVLEGRATTIAAHGHNIYNLLFGIGDLHSTALAGYDLSELWAVIGDRRFKVKDRSGQAVPIRSDGQQALALSPDGGSVVTALAVRNIPPEWEALYTPPWPSAPYRIKPGHQNAAALDGGARVSEYVRIQLSDGQTKTLTGAPIGSDAGWWAFLKAAWSSDGRSVVLPDTFIPPDPQSQKSEGNPPCTAVVELETDSASCLERLRGQASDGAGKDQFRLIRSVDFLPGSDAHVAIRYLLPDGSIQSQYYSRGPSGSWAVDSRVAAERASSARPIHVLVKQDLNAPPVLVGTDNRTKVSRIIWDPNPQLKQIALGEVSALRWKDNTGRDWIGGLYKPPDYVQGRRYPLVIQTHGFRQKSFDPSGVFPTAFAAQELAAAEMIVLQVEDCPIRLTVEEALCQVAGYEAAVKQLAGAGLVDPNRVGIIGFSRTCYYVMQALTQSKLHLRAASITDGMVLGYVQYIMSWDVANNDAAREAVAMIGAQPFGKGLENWLNRSPEFNMDKIETPLQIVARGRANLLTLWEPYAGLRYLNKPVDLLLLTQTGTHVLTNPEQEAASQTATVDWFRFWLSGEEDSSPRKRGQYARWRELRNLQEANSRGETTGVAIPAKNQ